MKIFNSILVMIAIINIMFSFSLILTESDMIIVNSKNEDIVKKDINGKIKNIDDITIITLGNGWHSGQLNIYHSSGKADTVYITEGSEYENLEYYIRENGIDLSKVGVIFFGSSIIIIVYLIIYSIIKIMKFINNKENK